jgi:hypothetical protein
MAPCPLHRVPCLFFLVCLPFCLFISVFINIWCLLFIISLLQWQLYYMLQANQRIIEFLQIWTRKYVYIWNLTCTWSDTICPCQNIHRNAPGGQILNNQNTLDRDWSEIRMKKQTENFFRILISTKLHLHLLGTELCLCRPLRFGKTIVLRWGKRVKEWTVKRIYNPINGKKKIEKN